MSAADEIRGLAGAALIVCGFLVVLLCGTCSLTFGFMDVVTAVAGRGIAPLSFNGPFLIAGAAAVAAGIGLIAAGVRVSRGAGGSPPQDQRGGQREDQRENQ